nr:hypothetical protein CFP56_54380 [Quercus suber]
MIQRRPGGSSKLVQRVSCCRASVVVVQGVVAGDEEERVGFQDMTSVRTKRRTSRRMRSLVQIGDGPGVPGVPGVPQRLFRHKYWLKLLATGDGDGALAANRRQGSSQPCVQARSGAWY